MWPTAIAVWQRPMLFAIEALASALRPLTGISSA